MTLSPLALALLERLTDTPQDAAALAAQAQIPHGSTYAPLWQLVRGGHAQVLTDSAPRRAAPCLRWRLRPQGALASVEVSPPAKAPAKSPLGDRLRAHLGQSPKDTQELAALLGAEYGQTYAALRRLLAEGAAALHERYEGHRLRLGWSRPQPQAPQGQRVHAHLGAQPVVGILRALPTPTHDPLVAQVRREHEALMRRADELLGAAPALHYVTPALLAERHRALLASGRIRGGHLHPRESHP